jgi:rhodanese-related sulfurtransferase
VGEIVGVEQLKLKFSSGAPLQLVDVRSVSEYGTGHVAGSINIPLEQIESRLGDLGSDPIILVCKTGTRARMAAGLLQACEKEICLLEGGTDAWTRAGQPLVSNLTTRWSLERQVRLGAGVMVLAGALLAVTTNVSWIYLSAFAGLGLTFAGLTDFCPMALLLGKMPWNGPRSCDGPIVDNRNRNCCS